MTFKDKKKFGEEKDNSYKVVFAPFVSTNTVLFLYLSPFGLIVLSPLHPPVTIRSLSILYR